MITTKTSVLQTLCLSHPYLSQHLTTTHYTYGDEQLWDYIVTLDGFNPKDFEKELGFTVKETATFVVDPGILSAYSYNHILLHRVFPLYESTTHVGMAITNPFNPTIPMFCSTKKATLYLVSPVLFEEVCIHHFPGNENILLDTIIASSITEHASDIHISQKEHHVSISRRIQGRLLPFMTVFNPDITTTLFRLIKLHANMNTASLQGPQDGRIRRTIDSITVDIRVASLPTLFGEDIVLRLCRSSDPVLTLENCGFNLSTHEHIASMLSAHSGLICVTGPTGSGKTTTLYAMITALIEQHRGQIISIEDPIERVIPAIRQSQLNLKANYSYTQALKASLRQDPDIIVIGEIRDKETARYVLDAAYTGHLVLTSLHTADVQSTLLRLLHFELDPFLISHCLKGIVSQRLVPKPCTHCSSGCSACRFTGVSSQHISAESFIPTHNECLTTSTIDAFIHSGSYIPFQHEI